MMRAQRTWRRPRPALLLATLLLPALLPPIPWLPALWLAAGPAAAQGTVADDAREATSRLELKLESGALTTRIVNAHFDFVPRNVLQPEDLGIAFRYDVETRRSSVREGMEGEVRLQAWRVLKDGQQQEAWASRVPGSQVEVRGDRLIATTLGCCGAGNSHVAIALSNGKVLYNASGDSPGANVATLDIPNTGPLGIRYIAVHGAFSASDATIFASSRNALALITYASPATPMQRMLLTFRQDTKLDDRYREIRMGWQAEKPNEVHGRALTLWQADGKREAAAVTGAALRIDIGDQQIILPLGDDRFNLQKAVVPPGLVLVEQPIP